MITCVALTQVTLSRHSRKEICREQGLGDGVDTLEEPGGREGKHWQEQGFKSQKNLDGFALLLG